jgi:hypothetical protein
MGKADVPKSDMPSIGASRTLGLLDFTSPVGTEANEGAYEPQAENDLGLHPLLLNAGRRYLLAYIMFLHDEIGSSYKKSTKKRGRPKTVFAGMDVEAKRAWIIWWYVRQQRVAGSTDVDAMTVSQLIEKVRSFPGGKKLFPKVTQERLASSVANGKAKLEISKDWTSETCEKFLPFDRNF